MKWIIVVGGLGLVSMLSGCCRNGPFSSAGSYGSYPSTPYYSAPAYTTTPNPCTCNP